MAIICSFGSDFTGLGKIIRQMWLFTRYGFYSVACADGADGKLDVDTVMVRSRRWNHLSLLKDRFPSIAEVEIVELPDRDYRYRIVIPKEAWASMVDALVREQQWSNFKDEARRFQGPEGAEYVEALHEVWRILYRLQRTEMSAGKRKQK